MADSHQLLADYFKNGSETAFRELVGRYIDLVYAAAVRLVDGDTHLAEDVAQTVFADLARLGRRLPDDVMLGGWLHRHTCFVAANTMRGRRRREVREKQAVEMNATEDHSASNLAHATPLLDEAIDRLDAGDRTAVVLRFFEQRDFRSVGEALGSSEEAARKRVGRALEKLQLMLKRQGVTISAGALAAALAGEAATAAPVGLAAAVSGVALSKAISGGGATPILFKIMALTKLNIAAAAAVIGLAATVIIQFQTNAKLGRENQELRDQLGPLAQLQADNERLTKVSDSAAKPIDDKQLNELLRLRGEVTSLKHQLTEAERHKEQARSTVPKPQANAADTTSETVDPARQLAISKLNYNRKWLLAFHMFAGDNQGQFPANFDQANPYFSRDTSTPGNEIDTNRSPAELEIIYHGSLSGIADPANTIIIRGQQPWQTPDGGWVNDYGFADGHSEIHKAADGNFEPWEQQHIQAARPTQ